MAYPLLQLWTILALIAALSYGQVPDTPEEKDRLIKEGTPEVSVECPSSEKHPKWNAPPGVKYQTSSTTFENGQVQSTLTIKDFTRSKAGAVTCENEEKDVITKQVDLIAVAETKLEPTFHYGDESATLSCNITMTHPDVTYTVESTTWMKDNKPLSALPESDRFTENAETNSLVINKPKRDDIGNYTAKIKVNKVDTPYLCEVEFKAEIVKINPIKVEPTYNEENTTAVLSCNITDRKVNKVEWLQNNTLVSKLETPDRFKVDQDSHALIIEKAERKDAGLYIARLIIEGLPEPYDCKVEFKAAPKVLAFKKSKNLIEKDKMELQCKVEGFPRPVVTWFKDGVALNMTQDERIELHTLNGYKNARLVIKSIEFSDEGDYTCRAFSSYFNQTNEKNITVRVKDKLAALWPFLGIVCEVIVLCAIIFIYEKRRNKRAEQEENKAQEADGPSMEKKEGLRHRGTSGNPGA